MHFKSLIIASLFLSACSVQPDEWKGTIESQPPVSIDDTSVNGNNWVWQNQRNKWFYRGGGEQVIDAFDSWDFDPQALVFRFEAPQQLNMYMGNPHSLYLKVFQLSDLKVFNDIVRTPAGVRELLTKPEKEIDTSILASNELTLAPHSSENMVIDRYKETRFVAIVAGYFQMDAENSVRIFAIPSVANRYQEVNYTIEDVNPFSTPAISESAKIKAWVDLGVTKISRMQMLAQ